MNTGRHILVVSQNTRTVNTLIAWLSPAGYELSVVNTFAAAKTHLNSAPDLLITDLKLQEHNGLHLALRAQGSGIPAIVLGPEDPVLAKDAHDLGAVYLNALPTRPDLLKVVGELLLARGAAVLAEQQTANTADMVWLSGARPGVGLDSHGRRVLLH